MNARSETSSDAAEMLRVSEVAALLKLSRSKTYSLIKSGTIPSIAFGRAVRVSRLRLVEWIAAHSQSQPE